MKTLTNYSAIVIIMIAFLGASTLQAQEWTKTQKEVWKVAQDAWAKWQEGDIDAAFVNVHAKYMGWNSEDPLPMSREKWLHFAKEFMKYVKLESYDIEPARILVYDNVAVIDYYFEYYSTFTKDDKSTEAHIKGKNAEFYIKEGGKWMLIGDMTLSKEEK